MDYGEAAAQVAAETSVAAERSKKARGGSNQERAQPALRRCGNCGETGHNEPTCKKHTEVSSELDASMRYIGSFRSVVEYVTPKQSSAWYCSDRQQSWLCTWSFIRSLPL
jgi:hypothetical protein